MSIQFIEELSLLQSRFTLAVVELAKTHNVNEEEAMKQAIATFNKLLESNNLKEILK